MEIRGKASDFGAFLDRSVGKVGYLIGTRGHLCTAELIQQKRAVFTGYQTTIDKYAAQWIGKVVADCMGIYEMFMNGGEWDRPLTAWRYGDVSTGSVYSLALSEGLRNGAISTLPKDVPYPIAVTFPGHVGFYHNGLVYQSSGHAFGLEKTDLTYTGHQSQPWANWYYLPWLDYGGETMLQKGDKGLSVTYWQKALLKWNPACLPKFGADSDFGGETLAATMAFQKAVGLSQSGLVDTLTYSHMLNYLSNVTAADPAIKAELDAAKLKIAGLTQDLAAANNQLIVEQNLSANYAQADANKKAELQKVAQCFADIQTIKDKYLF